MPAANAAGWHRTNVTVALRATDEPGGSGVKSITFSATGAQVIPQATMTGSTASVPITAEGVTTLSFFATDQAGNAVAPQTLVVRIDKSPPEAALRFDPVRQDLVVLGQDALSGVPSGPVTPTVQDHLRTFTIRDRADNTLVLTAQVRHDEQALTASVLSLQANGGVVQTAAANRLRFEWQRDGGHLQELAQEVRVGGEPARQTAEAQFEAEKNQTRIELRAPDREQQLTRPGLVLLQLVTNKGALQITF
jgi:hypothetical protein